MTERAWKRAERGIARIVGGERVPVNGRGDLPDVLSSRFSVEVKNRALPEWVLHAVQQAEIGKWETDKDYHMAVIHYPGTQFGSSLALLRIKDLMRILEGGA